MDISKLIAVLFLLAISNQSLADKHPFKTANEETLFRNFSLAICTGMAYEKFSKEIATDTGKAATGYREYSHIDLQAYEESRKLVNKWLKKDYQSKHGGQIDIMKCIDLYNSKELIRLFKRFDPCKNRGAWLDAKEYQQRCE